MCGVCLLDTYIYIFVKVKIPKRTESSVLINMQSDGSSMISEWNVLKIE